VNFIFFFYYCTFQTDISKDLNVIEAEYVVCSVIGIPIFCNVNSVHAERSGRDHCGALVQAVPFNMPFPVFSCSCHLYDEKNNNLNGGDYCTCFFVCVSFWMKISLRPLGNARPISVKLS
jgi:hypothetical protein